MLSLCRVCESCQKLTTLFLCQKPCMFRSLHVCLGRNQFYGAMTELLSNCFKNSMSHRHSNGITTKPFDLGYKNRLGLEVEGKIFPYIFPLLAPPNKRVVALHQIDKIIITLYVS
jgi:hypothetical protein